MEDGGPSITARRVAAHRLGFTRVPAPYGDPAADDSLATEVAAGREAPLNRMHDYLAARTSFFDRIVVAAIARGVRQIVVGAAGYDGRAMRYAKPGVRWFEVDHPATQQDKLRRLARLGIATPQVRFVEADFTQDPLAERLLAAGLDPAAPSLFLLEGVAVYLKPAVLETVLDQLRQVAAPGSRLVISVSLSRAHDKDSRARFQASVAAMGEPAMSAFDAGEAEDLLARHGWQIMAAGEDTDDLQAAKRQRQRSAGLLVARAGPRAPASPGQQPSSGQQPSPEGPAGQRTRTPGSPPAHPVLQSPGTLSLSALLSQALVAFTIEFDNEAEHRLPHHTTNFGAGSQGDGVWLVSLVMWENCMRFVTDEPITVGELETFARTGTNLDGMRRWGYVTIDGTSKKVHKSRPGPDAVLRATAKGLRARQVWLPLSGLIEERWRERFGPAQLALLRDSLTQLVGQLDPGLPDCLPILGAGLLSRGPDSALPPPRAGQVEVAGLPLPALLSRALLSFALEYERESKLSLAVGANLLRVLDREGTRLRDLPPLAGISKEAVSWAMGVLVRSRLAVEAPDPAATRGKVARPTIAGIVAQSVYHELVGIVEQRWQERFTGGTVSALRRALETLAAATDGQPPPLFGGLTPYPDNWRAQVRPPGILPHYPMVLHRGGYPDGS